MGYIVAAANGGGFEITIVFIAFRVINEGMWGSCIETVTATEFGSVYAGRG